MAQSKFTISLLGFDSRSADTLQENTKRTMRVINPITEGETQVVVIDMDVPESSDIWSNFRNNWPHMPAVLLSSNEIERDDASYVEKPFTAESLIDKITEAILLAPSAEEIAERKANVAEAEIANVDDPVPSPAAVEEEPVVTDEPDQELEVVNLDEFADEDGESEAASEAESESDSEPTFAEIFGEAPVHKDPARQESKEELSEMFSTGVYDMSAKELEAITTGALVHDEEHEEEHEEEHDAATIEPEAAEVEDQVTQADQAEDEAETVDAAEEAAPVEPEPEPVPSKDLPPLSQVANILSSRTSQSRKLDTPNPNESYFDPDAHVIGLILKGIEQGRDTGAIARLNCLLDRFICIDAKNKVVCSNLKDIHMRQIAIAPLGEGESGLDTKLEMIESTLEEVTGSKGSSYPLESFVWELAVLTSKGRAPKGIPMDEPIYLKQWPNFTRLVEIPNAMKISAYWIRLPSSINNIAMNLKVPVSDLLSFYSAAHLTGLAGLAQRNSDKLMKPGKPEEHEKRNLFGSIMGSLRKKQ